MSCPKLRDVAPGERVFVHWNSVRKCWSLRALDGPDKGRVVAHRDKLLLVWCDLKVSEAGRQRVLRTGHKTVHAGVVGYVSAAPLPVALPSRLTYRPADAARFQSAFPDGVPGLVREADAVAFDGRDVYAWGARW